MRGLSKTGKAEELIYQEALHEKEKSEKIFQDGMDAIILKSKLQNIGNEIFGYPESQDNTEDIILGWVDLGC